MNSFRFPCPSAAVVRLFRARFLAIFALIFAAISQPAFATPLNPRGIPEGTVFFLHLDLDAARKSQTFSAALALCDAAVPDFANFKRTTGIDLLSDSSGVAVGIFSAPKTTAAATSQTPPPAAAAQTPQASAQTPQKSPSAPVPTPEKSAEPPNDAVSLVALVRGRFDPQQIFTAAHAAGFSSRLVDGYTFIEIPFADHADWKLYLTPLGVKSCALLTDISQAHAVIAAYRSDAPSVAVPPDFHALARETAATGTAVLSAFSSKTTAIRPERAAKFLGGNLMLPDRFLLAVAADAQNLRLHATGDYPSEVAANQSCSSLQGLVALLQMLRLGSDPEDANPASNPAAPAASPNEIAALLAALRITSEARSVQLNMEYPAAKLTDFLQKSLARKRANLRKSASTAEKSAK